MGKPEVKRLTSRQQQERRRRHKDRARYGSITKPRKDNSQCGKRSRFSGPNLPEDIWCHIHSLMPMRDSARVARVSRSFLHAWTQHPYLILNRETLGFAGANGDITRSFTSIVDQIMKNHSGPGVKTLELELDRRDLNPCYLNRWLQIGITPGTENVTLMLPKEYKEWFSFPCSLLFGRNGSSIQHLHLTHCAFHPTIGTGCLRSLTKLYLYDVCVTGDELECLLSNSFALTLLELTLCNDIICLNIPCVLEQFSCLTVSGCDMLQIIESKAPNLSTIDFEGNLVQLSLGQPLKVKDLNMECSDDTNFLYYAITKLPYIVPNLENLTLCSISETVNTPMVGAKFLHLKYLEIYLDGDLSPGYDYLSLGYFLDASPVLETFILCVYQNDMNFDSVFGDPLHIRQIPGHKHDSLEDVIILGFCSAKSMVELTCHILENATKLESITLDTIFDKEDEDGIGRCSVSSDARTGGCFPQSKRQILEARRALMAIKKHIVGKVPSTVELDVRGPCSRCHTLEV